MSTSRNPSRHVVTYTRQQRAERAKRVFARRRVTLCDLIVIDAIAGTQSPVLFFPISRSGFGLLFLAFAVSANWRPGRIAVGRYYADQAVFGRVAKGCKAVWKGLGRGRESLGFMSFRTRHTLPATAVFNLSQTVPRRLTVAGCIAPIRVRRRFVFRDVSAGVEGRIVPPRKLAKLIP